MHFSEFLLKKRLRRSQAILKKYGDLDQPLIYFPKVGEISRAGLAFSSGTDSAPSVGLDFQNSGTVTNPPADMVIFFSTEERNYQNIWN